MFIKIAPIAAARDPEIVAVLTNAFASDEHFARAFLEGTPGRPQRIAATFARGCKDGRAIDATFLGATRHGELLGVALVVVPGQCRPVTWLDYAWIKVLGRLTTLRIGLGTSRRFKAYDRVIKKHFPVEPATSSYVCYLGVVPTAQRAGIGGRLLEAAYEVAREDELSRSLRLHTINARLAASLKRKGWTVEAAPLFDGLTAHSCVRAYEATDDAERGPVAS